MTKMNQAAKSMVIIVVLSLGSKFLGFIREALIAAKFGSGMVSDAFFIAITAIGLLTILLGTAINTTMIPILSEVEAHEGKDGKKVHFSNILNIVFAASLVLILFGWIFAPVVVRVMASGFKGEQYELAVLLIRIGLLGIIFSSAVSSFRGYLQSESMFTESAAANFPFNFVYISFLLFLSSQFGIKGLMVANVIALASQLVIQIPGLKRTGYKYWFIFDVKDKYAKQVLKLVPPVLLGVAINDLNAIVDRTLASGLVSGSISALNYANLLNDLILVVFISAITTVIFPMLSEKSSIQDLDDMKKTIGYGVNLILLITIPATTGLIALALPIVQVAFQRGAFDGNAALMTSQALVFYSIGLSAMGLNLLITKVYYSLQDTKTPMVYGIVSVAINILLNFILVRYLAHKGLALATSIATTISTLLMFYRLKVKIGALGSVKYIRCAVKAGAASIITGVASYTTYHWMSSALISGNMNSLFSLLTAVGTGFSVYVSLCYLLRVEEIGIIIERVRQQLLRNNRV